MVAGVLTRSADCERVTRPPKASLASLLREVERSLVLCEIGW